MTECCPTCGLTDFYCQTGGVDEHNQRECTCGCRWVGPTVVVDIEVRAPDARYALRGQLGRWRGVEFGHLTFSVDGQPAFWVTAQADPQLKVVEATRTNGWHPLQTWAVAYDPVFGRLLNALIGSYRLTMDHG